MNKPLKGVIVAWMLYNNRIHGVLVVTDVGREGVQVKTSEVISIDRRQGNVLVCETLNSRYILS